MSLEYRKGRRLMTDSTDMAELRQRIEGLEAKLAALEEGFAVELASIVQSIQRMTDRTRDFMAMTSGALQRMAAETRGERPN